MLRRFFILGFWIAAIGLDSQALAAVQQPATPPAKQDDEAPPAMAVPPSFKYESQGRRDPFVNPMPKPVKPPPEIPIVRPPGLKGILLSEAQVAGVVWSQEPDMNRVVISAPGGRVYFAQKGEALFDAVLKEIQRDGVVFQLRTKDKDGKITTQDVVRKVRSTP